MQNSRTKVVTLEYPVDWKGAAVKELTVRRPKGADMRFLPKSGEVGPEDMFPFFALLTGMDEQFFDEMDAADITTLGETVNGFLSKKKPRR